MLGDADVQPGAITQQQGVTDQVAVYAVVAYLLNLGDIVPEDFVLKVSISLPVANPATARVLEDLGECHLKHVAEPVREHDGEECAGDAAHQRDPADPAR